MSLPSPRDNLKQTAELYRWAVGHSLIERQEVWRWCEQVVAQHPNPPLFLVEAVELKPEGLRALRAVLSQMPGVCDTAAVARWAFGLQFVYLDESPGRLPKVFWQFSDDIFEAQVIGELARAEIVRLQERWGAIQIGVITQQGVNADIRKLTKDVLGFLQRESRIDFKAYRHLKGRLPKKVGKEERALPDASQFGAKSLLFWAELIMETSPPVPVESLNLKETALFYARALHIGLVGMEEAVAWCGSLSAPEAAALQRALAQGKDAPEVLDALWEVEGESDDDAVYRRLFGKMHEVLSSDRMQAPKVFAGLDVLSLDFPPVTREVAAEMNYFAGMGLLFAPSRFKPDDELTMELTEKCLDFLHHAARGAATNYRKEAAESDALRKGFLRVTLLFIALSLGAPLLSWWRSGLTLGEWWADILAHQWAGLTIYLVLGGMSLSLAFLYYCYYVRKES